MWFYTNSNMIISGPERLPKLWVNNNVQHPLREFEKKGYLEELDTFGWKKRNIISVPISPYQNIIGYTNTINGTQVDSTPVFENKTTEEIRDIRLQEIRDAGYALIDSEIGDERQKMRVQMNSLIMLDEQTRRGGNRGPELDVLVIKATYIESIHQIIDQAEIDLTTHMTPETYNINWPSPI